MVSLSADRNSPDNSRGLLYASVRAGERQHCRARAAPPRSGAVVRDFKDHAFPMAEERWSVPIRQEHSKRFDREFQARN